MLIYPNPESALNEEAGKLLLEAYEEFSKHAKLMTSIHARPAKKETQDAVTNNSAASSTADKKKPVAATVVKKPAEKKKTLKRL